MATNLPAAKRCVRPDAYAERKTPVNDGDVVPVPEGGAFTVFIEGLAISSKPREVRIEVELLRKSDSKPVCSDVTYATVIVPPELMPREFDLITIDVRPGPSRWGNFSDTDSSYFRAGTEIVLSARTNLDESFENKPALLNQIIDFRWTRDDEPAGIGKEIPFVVPETPDRSRFQVLARLRGSSDRDQRAQHDIYTMSCAYPVNFRWSKEESNIAPGFLQLLYRWDSSTGKLADLKETELGELVFFEEQDWGIFILKDEGFLAIGPFAGMGPEGEVLLPGEFTQWNYARRFYNGQNIGGRRSPRIPGEDGTLTDTHTAYNPFGSALDADDVRKVLAAASSWNKAGLAKIARGQSASFVAQQWYFYKCEAEPGESFVFFSGPYTLAREVARRMDDKLVFRMRKEGGVHTEPVVSPDFELPAQVQVPFSGP